MGSATRHLQDSTCTEVFDDHFIATVVPRHRWLFLLKKNDIHDFHVHGDNSIAIFHTWDSHSRNFGVGNYFLVY